MNTIKWKQKTHKYSNGKVGYVGKWKCFSIDWDSGTSQSDNKKYKLTTTLPGLKSVIANYEKEEDAKERAISVLDFWMVGLNNNEG